MMDRTDEHKMSGRSTHFRAGKHKSQVGRLGVFAAQLHPMASNGRQADSVAAEAFFDAVSRFRFHIKHSVVLS